MKQQLQRAIALGLGDDNDQSCAEDAGTQSKTQAMDVADACDEPIGCARELRLSIAQLEAQLEETATAGDFGRAETLQADIDAKRSALQHLISRGAAAEAKAAAARQLATAVAAKRFEQCELERCAEADNVATKALWLPRAL